MSVIIKKLEKYMPKFLKYFLIVAGAIIFILFVGIVSLVTLVNPNNYKPLMVNLFHQATGREIKLDGDISWKIMPGIGLHLNQVSITNPSSFKTTESNFLTINKIDVSLDILPLLFHKTIISELSLNGMKLNLLQNQTINNWSFNAIGESGLNVNNKDNNKDNMIIELNNINLLDSSISYSNLYTHKNYKINPFSLSLISDFSGQLFFDMAKEKIKLVKLILI